MKRVHVVAVALGAVLMSTAAYGAPRYQDDVQAPRSDELQAPRYQDEVQSPRGQDGSAPRDKDEVQSPRGQSTSPRQ